MRSEKEVREELDRARRRMSSTTDDLSHGRLGSFDFTTLAGSVGMIQALEWVLGKSGTLEPEVSPLRKPLDEI